MIRTIDTEILGVVQWVKDGLKVKYLKVLNGGIFFFKVHSINNKVLFK